MERWYTLWNIGYGQNGYPLELQEVLDEINDQPNVEHSVGMTVADVLGFYVPLGEQVFEAVTLIGTIINANADVYEWKDGETQVDIYNYIWGASVIHFPNAKIGQGGFVRTDLGLAFVSAEVFYDNKIEQVQSDLGVGVLAGGGYAWPIGKLIHGGYASYGRVTICTTAGREGLLHELRFDPWCSVLNLLSSRVLLTPFYFISTSRRTRTPCALASRDRYTPLASGVPLSLRPSQTIFW